MRSPKTVILSLFKIAVRVKPYKDRVLLHLPAACPVKSIRAQANQYGHRSVNDFARLAGNPPCEPLHDLARLAHETTPPPFPITDSRFIPPTGVEGASPENQKMALHFLKSHRCKFMQSSG